MIFLKNFIVQSTIYIGNMEQNSKKPSLSDNSIGFVEKFESTENTSDVRGICLMKCSIRENASKFAHILELGKSTSSFSFYAVPH